MKNKYLNIPAFFLFFLFTNLSFATFSPINIPSNVSFLSKLISSIFNSKTSIPSTNDHSELKTSMKNLSHLSPLELAKFLKSLPEKTRSKMIEIISFEWIIGEGLLTPSIWINWWGALALLSIMIISGGVYSIIKSKKDDRLPTKAKFPNAEYPYDGKRNKSGEYSRNERGDFIDKHGDGWRWHMGDQEFDVQVNDGESHINVDETGKVTHGAKPEEVGRRTNPDYIELEKK